MKLSAAEEFGLLRSLVEWRRKNGWKREYRVWDHTQHDHTYDHESGLSVEVTMHRIELIPGDPRVVYEVGAEMAGHVLFHGWPWSVRSAVNGIGAAEVIPPEMAPVHSSAFAAGRESVGRLVEADGETRFETEKWYDDGTSDVYHTFGMSGVKVQADRVADGARRDVEEDEEVVRTEARSYLVHTYRVDEKVLGRFGDWGNVDELQA